MKDNFNPPDSPVQFVNDDEICSHKQYEPECNQCKEDIEDMLSDIIIKERKENGDL